MEILVAIWGFVAAHEAIFSLIALAAIATMRPKLPCPLNRVELFNWLYEWFVDACRTFMSFRGAAPHAVDPPPVKKEEPHNDA